MKAIMSAAFLLLIVMVMMVTLSPPVMAVNTHMVNGQIEAVISSGEPPGLQAGPTNANPTFIEVANLQTAATIGAHGAYYQSDQEWINEGVNATGQANSNNSYTAWTQGQTNSERVYRTARDKVLRHNVASSSVSVINHSG